MCLGNNLEKYSIPLKMIIWNLEVWSSLDIDILESSVIFEASQEKYIA